MDNAPRPIFNLSSDDVSPQASAAARDRDAHLGTLIIGLFLGMVFSICCIGFGKWVF